MLTYQRAAELFATVRDTAKGKKLATATYLVKLGSTAYGIKYHDTVVVRIFDNGIYELNSGGYKTATTKRRINEYGPVRVVQRAGQWKLVTGDSFKDNQPLDSLGVVI